MVDFFVCTYTNSVKDYCDSKFFRVFNDLAKDLPSLIVDNTGDRMNHYDRGGYSERLRTLTDVKVVHYPRTPGEFLFQRNVCDSVNLCREAFLKSASEAMLIIESDVIPPDGVLDVLAVDIEIAKASSEAEWGIVGCLYYRGFHDFSLTGLRQDRHILSGCTAYSRSLIEQFPFRWDRENPGAFPDFYMSMDSIESGRTNWNDYDVRCDHEEKLPGDRGLGDLIHEESERAGLDDMLDSPSYD